MIDRKELNQELTKKEQFIQNLEKRLEEFEKKDSEKV